MHNSNTSYSRGYFIMPKTQATLQHPIEATDRQIDVLVYELYGLTEEEIKIVEDGT